nr:LOW QUALITY PROTEIN: putative uncharacterized protein C16orf47 homolog [Microcebus murinus]
MVSSFAGIREKKNYKMVVLKCHQKPYPKEEPRCLVTTLGSRCHYYPTLQTGKLRHRAVIESQQGTEPGFEPPGSDSRTDTLSSGTNMQLPRLLRGQRLSSSAPVSSAETKATHPCAQGLSSSPIHHQSPVNSPVDARLSLDVSVPEQRCSSCYLGRLWPQKYLVSSHSLKWN